MAEPKTRPTTIDPFAVIAGIADEARRQDCLWLVETMQRATGAPPVMWGTGIIGFGSYPYQGASSSGLWPLIGFGPQTKTLSVYVMPGFDGVKELLAQLGPHSHGVSCLYLKSLDRVDRPILKRLIERTVSEMRQRTNNGTTPFVHGKSEYATSAVKARRDAMKATPKKATPKKATPKKATPKKATTKKATTRKATTKKATTKKATTKKATAKKATTKKATRKKAATKKA